ncbi:MAG: hypothetical protein ACJAW3_001194 [Lentimonas sp.]|jgi:hypothetical protein
MEWGCFKVADNRCLILIFKELIHASQPTLKGGFINDVDSHRLKTGNITKISLWAFL